MRHRSHVSNIYHACSGALVDLGQLAFAPLRMPERNPALQGMLAYAHEDLARMRRCPLALARPVVLFNGYHAWAGLVASLRRQLVALTSHDPRDVLDISYFAMSSFPAIRRYAIDQVRRELGEDAELDAVGISMGGLISRLVSLPDERDSRVLRVRRIFTFASPHCGARLAASVRPNAAARDMQPGCAFITSLNQRLHPCLRCYAQTNDTIVGARNTAPPGVMPYWASGTWLMSHFTTSSHPIFLADLARNLRGESPLLPPHAASAPPCD